MEILFILEPVAFAIAIISNIACILSTVAFIIGISELFEKDCSFRQEHKLLRKWGLRVLIISVISIITIQPFTQPFDIYKKILVYRGIESKTADKLVDNFNKLMDISAKKLEKWENEK